MQVECDELVDRVQDELQCGTVEGAAGDGKAISVQNQFFGSLFRLWTIKYGLNANRRPVACTLTYSASLLCCFRVVERVSLPPRPLPTDRHVDVDVAFEAAAGQVWVYEDVVVRGGGHPGQAVVFVSAHARSTGGGLRGPRAGPCHPRSHDGERHQQRDVHLAAPAAHKQVQYIKTVTHASPPKGGHAVPSSPAPCPGP